MVFYAVAIFLDKECKAIYSRKDGDLKEVVGREELHRTLTEC